MYERIHDLPLLAGASDKIDVIYNFACPASPPRYQALPLETMRTCFDGTMNVLNIACAHEAIVVHASTSEVYGDPLVSPQPESYWGNVNPWGERSVYDVGKKSAESLCHTYLKMGVDVRVVRIFNTYGPHIDPDDGRVISNFIKQAGNSAPITVYGDGSQTRSFCYVDDLIDGITAVASAETNYGSPINLGNPNEFTVLELAERVSKMFGVELVVQNQRLPSDDPTRRCPDISIAKKFLKWEPKVQLNEGLRKLALYWHKQGVISNIPIG
jgi:UDP-glucuronate decarboxylase